MNRMTRPLVLALSAAVLAAPPARTADPEPDWETTTRYLKKYIEDDGAHFGTTVKTVTADQKNGTVAVVTTAGVGGTTKATETVRLKNVDPQALRVEDCPDFRDRNPDTTRKVYRVNLKSYPPAPGGDGKAVPCVNTIWEERAVGKPSKVEEFNYPDIKFYFTTEEAANRAAKAFRRAIALARQADTPDPFADKPKSGAPPAATSPGPSGAATRRKAELEVLDLKDRIEKQTKALEAAAKALGDCKAESKKLADLRAKETDERKRAVIVAAQVVMLTQVQEAEKKKTDCETALRASKAELERREKDLANRRD